MDRENVNTRGGVMATITVLEVIYTYPTSVICNCSTIPAPAGNKGKAGYLSQKSFRNEVQVFFVKLPQAAYKIRALIKQEGKFSQ